MLFWNTGHVGPSPPDQSEEPPTWLRIASVRILLYYCFRVSWSVVVDSVFFLLMLVLSDRLCNVDIPRSNRIQGATASLYH